MLLLSDTRRPVPLKAGLREHLDTARRLWNHPRAAREEVVRFQNRKLQVLIQHAYANVSYYRRCFDDAGVRPSEIRSASDLSRLPVTTKADLHVQPTRVRRSVFEDQILNLFRVRTLHLLGRRISDRGAKIGSAGVPSDKKPSRISMPLQNSGFTSFSTSMAFVLRLTSRVIWRGLSPMSSRATPVSLRRWGPCGPH